MLLLDNMLSFNVGVKTNYSSTICFVSFRNGSLQELYSVHILCSTSNCDVLILSVWGCGVETTLYECANHLGAYKSSLKSTLNNDKSELAMSVI